MNVHNNQSKCKIKFHNIFRPLRYLKQAIEVNDMSGLTLAWSGFLQVAMTTSGLAAAPLDTSCFTISSPRPLLLPVMRMLRATISLISSL